ncbi:adh short domain containing protein, partial [Asbolus verrucosus]
WCRSQTCLVGRTALVTGADRACHREEAAEEAQAKIVCETGNPNVSYKLIELESFASVREFAQNFRRTEDRLDILVNNAGVAQTGDRRSEDGCVWLLQVNYFSSFLLTNLLIGLMRRSEPSRIVNVSSIHAKYVRKFDVTNLNQFSGNSIAYGHSKLCLILFTMELARKLEGTGVTTYSLHPGTVATDHFANASRVPENIIKLAKKIVFKTPEEGSQTQIYCSVQRGIEHLSGQHFENCEKVDPYPTAMAPKLREKLWEISEEIVHDMVCIFFVSFVIITVIICIDIILRIYTKLSTGWCRCHTCLVGKTAIITGANRGIGYATALDFAKRGAKVILACRNSRDAESAKNNIIEKTGNCNIFVKIIEMDSFASVRAFAANINETEERLDILVNNAGIASAGDQITRDGCLTVVEVNYFSAFLLTNLLLGLMKKSKPSRVINVSSLLAKCAYNFDVNALNKFQGHIHAYSASKLCMILFTMELRKKGPRLLSIVLLLEGLSNIVVNISQIVKELNLIRPHWCLICLKSCG